MLNLEQLSAINISLLTERRRVRFFSVFFSLMPKKKIKLLDTVALVDDLPERKLKRGEVGTVVEILAPDVFEVEFCDDDGRTYAELALRAKQLIALDNQALKVVA